MSKNLSTLARRKGLEDSLYKQLHGARSPSEIAQTHLVGEANVHAARSFYSGLADQDANLKAKVCDGTACIAAATEGSRDLHRALTERFGDEGVGSVSCLGRCFEGGAVQVEGRVMSGQKSLDSSTPPERENSIPVQPLADGPLTAKAMDLAQYRAVCEILTTRSSTEWLQTLSESDLRGCGGAGFPLGRKWLACREAPGSEKYLICNADEGDPGAYSDLYLLLENPLQVLAGMLIGGHLSGAGTGIIYLREEYPAAARSIALAIEQVSGCAPSGTTPFQFELVIGAGSYICGEETALIASLEGRRPEVATRPPYPVTEGLFRQPTIVNNVETLANVPWIIEHGASAYRGLGLDACNGTKLVCLDSLFNNPGVVEIPMGTPLSQVVYEHGGGFKVPVKAIQVGGPLGGVVPLSRLNHLNVDYDTFTQQGFMLGHAGIVSIPEELPAPDLLLHLFRFVADESCGKCFPCRLGSQRGTELLQRANSGGEISRLLFEELLETLELGSLCGLGSGLTLPARNLVTYFEEEFAGIWSDS